MHKLDQIYFAMSKDMCNNNSVDSIWHLSQQTLPYPLTRCMCMITRQNTKHPKLLILGGYNDKPNEAKTCVEYELCDILGYDTFYRFMLDFKKVK